jgi:hypothetical protein
LALTVRLDISNFLDSLSTTQLGFQRTVGVEDTYILGTVPERLYKRVAKAYESNKSNGAFVLTPDVLAPTLEEIAVVQAEVDDDALTKAIETVKTTARSSSRHQVRSLKVQLNKATG